MIKHLFEKPRISRIRPHIKPLWMLTNKNDYHNYHNDEDTHTADDYNGDKDNIDE